MTMYKLIRPHHSFYLTGDVIYEEFQQIAAGNLHFSHLLIQKDDYLLLTWCVAFNMWQFLVKDDRELIVNPEMRMIYPAISFILKTLQQEQVVVRFRTHYQKNHELVYYATIMLTNAFFYWYFKNCSPLLTDDSMSAFFKTDIYELFEQTKNSQEGYPIELVKVQTATLEVLTETTINDKDELSERLKEAIEEAKQYYYFMVQEV